jgi:hypothetical protein
VEDGWIERRAASSSDDALGTNLIGLVKHLASVEYGRFCDTFGREDHSIPFDPNDPDAYPSTASRRRAIPRRATAFPFLFTR